MNPQTLFLLNGKPSGIFFCEKCRSVRLSEELAEQCCQNYKCRVCGKDTGSRSWLICDACRHKEDQEKEQARFLKAEKLNTYDGPVYCEGLGTNGDFSPSLSEFIDHCDDEGIPLPGYVWACTENRFVNAKIGDILCRITDDAYEDFEPECLHGIGELKFALEAFNEANKYQIAWEPDFTRAVLIK